MVEPTHLKNISQIGNLPQVEVKIKYIWNHHLVKMCMELGTQANALDVGTPPWKKMVVSLLDDDEPLTKIDGETRKPIYKKWWPRTSSGFLTKVPPTIHTHAHWWLLPKICEFSLVERFVWSCKFVQKRNLGVSFSKNTFLFLWIASPHF